MCSELSEFQTTGEVGESRSGKPRGTSENAEAAVASLWRGLLFAGAPQLEERRRHPDYGGQAGTDSSLITLTQHFVLGFREVPAGPIFSNRQQRS
jgi:hypothetical protein